MRLPGAELAVVEERKVRECLLNPVHPRGSSKAAYFARFGYAPSLWEDLSEALRVHGRTFEVAAVVRTPYSVQYVVEGELSTPEGRSPRVRTVWEVREGDPAPRLLTAYPCR